jgi:hypothetical protein
LVVAALLGSAPDASHREAATAKNRHERKESERFKRFTYEELIKRDKLGK